MTGRGDSLSENQWHELVENFRDMYNSLELLEDMTYHWDSDHLLTLAHISDVSVYCETVIIHLLSFILLVFKKDPPEHFQDSLKDTYNKCCALNYQYGDAENYLKMTPLSKKDLEKDRPHTTKQLIDIMYMNVTYIYSIRQHYRISEDISNITYTQLSDCIKKLDSCLMVLFSL